MANEETLAALLSGAFSNRAPADLEQFGKTISQNNLYNMAAAPIMQTKFDTSTWSPTQKIASAFLQSFLGNSLAEYGRKSDAEQIAKVNQVLPQLYNDPSSVALPEGVDRGAFEAFRATQINRKAQTDEAIRNSLGQRGINLSPDKKAQAFEGYSSAIAETLGDKSKGMQPRGAYAAAIEKFGDENLARELVKKQAPEFQEPVKVDKEAEAEETKRQYALDFVKSKLAEAKNISTASTFNPFGSANTKMESIRNSIENVAQAIAGREYNTDFAKQFRKILPSWSDTEAQIDEKEKQLSDLVNQLSIQKSKSGLPTEAANNTVTTSAITPQDYAALRAKGLTKDQIRSMYGR